MDENKENFNTENEETTEFSLPEEEKNQPEVTVETPSEKETVSSDNVNSSSYSHNPYSQSNYNQSNYSQNPYSQSNYSQYSQQGQNYQGGYYYTGTPDNNSQNRKKNNKVI